MCSASYTAFASLTTIPGVAFTASVTLFFVTVCPLSSLHRGRVCVTCLLNFRTPATSCRSFELVCRPSDEAHVCERSVWRHGHHVVTCGTSANPVTFSRIRVSDDSEIIPRQTSRKRFVYKARFTLDTNVFVSLTKRRVGWEICDCISLNAAACCGPVCDTFHWTALQTVEQV